MEIKNCPKYYNLLSKPTSENNIFLTDNTISFNALETIVCCPKGEEVPPTRRPTIIETTPQSSDEYLNSLSDLLPKNCGKVQLMNKIFNGDETGIKEHPWLVAIMYEEVFSKKLTNGCGGTIISSRFVLSAAHCEEISHSRRGVVRVGEWRFSQSPDCKYHRGKNNCNPKETDIPISKWISHEEYDDNQKHHDIALVKLRREINFTKYLASPICLPLEPSTWNYPNQTLLEVAGWGYIENEDASNTKLKVQIPVFDNECCAKSYEKLKREIVESQVS